MKQESNFQGVPLQIYESTQTGRRYIIMYLPEMKRFNAFRLDYIKSIKITSVYDNYDYYKKKFDTNSAFCWGVSFGNSRRSRDYEEFKMNLMIDEQKEQYILDRLHREGRNGTVARINDNTYLYTTQVFDTNEMMPWVKSFTGRIISIEGTNQQVIDKFYQDIGRMKRMYCEKE
jgi:hypothetical protein